MPGKEVTVIHHPIDKIRDMSTPFAQRADLLFVGSSHPPNTDAILFYAKEIMPVLLEKMPGIKMYVAGGNPDSKIREIESANIVLTGFVKDLLPLFEKCRIYCAPLRYGAGVKGKIIEAMSYGLPIVTTSVGAEGLGVTGGEHLLISDSADGIADSILGLYNDENLWERLSRNSRQYVSVNLSQEAFRKKVEGLMEGILGRTGAAGHI